MGRVIPGNTRRISTIVAVPDRESTSLAGSLAVATNPFSPMSSGPVRMFAGLAGFGANRMGQDLGPMQAFKGVVLPFPGTPYTPQGSLPATIAGTTSSLAWMSANSLKAGM